MAAPIVYNAAPSQGADGNNVTFSSPEAQQIYNDFTSFGYYPTQAEIAAFGQSDDALAGGATSGEASALTNSFIGQYVQTMNAEKQRQATDPLNAYQQQAQKIADQQQLQSTNLYSQAQQVFQNAPQLFGSLTPDQITQYLAPLQTAFTQAQSQTQAQEAARGLTGSNIEANALQTGNTNFQNQVLQTGLQVGQTAQTNVGNSLQTQAGGLQTASNNNRALQGQAAGQISSQNLSQQNYLNSLPFLYGQASQANQATQFGVQYATQAQKDAENAQAISEGVSIAGLITGAPPPGGTGGTTAGAKTPATTTATPQYSPAPNGLQTIAQLKATQPQVAQGTPNYLGGLS